MDLGINLSLKTTTIAISAYSTAIPGHFLNGNDSVGDIEGKTVKLSSTRSVGHTSPPNWVPKFQPIVLLPLGEAFPFEITGPGHEEIPMSYMRPFHFLHKYGEFPTCQK